MIFVILVPVIVGAAFLAACIAFALFTIIVGAVRFIRTRYVNYGTRN